MKDSEKTIFDASSLDSRLSTIMAEIGFMRGQISELHNSTIAFRDSTVNRVALLEKDLAEFHAVKNAEKDHARSAATWISLLIGSITVVINILVNFVVRR